ncbi:RNA binding protein [Aureococcus anophagefferens]|uniref:RNA binding protein n=1 Tax=Aureococcus anophagefferens TaxID=44056 RepID=A0ABR1G6R5_AURAN
MMGYGAPAPPQLPTLPPPWIATPDPATGVFYFVNTQTHETSWTPPPGSIPVHPPPPPVAAPQFAAPPKDELPCATCYECPCQCAPAGGPAAPAPSDPAYDAWKAVMGHLESGSRLNETWTNAPADQNPLYRQNVDGVCVPYNRGNCRKGERCKYDHRFTPAAMAVANYVEPRTLTREELARGRPARRKPCFDFVRKGKCDRGDHCPYSHEDPAMLKDEDKKPCFDLLRHGRCLKGDACVYAHTGHEGLPAKPRRPCFRMQREGRCDKGAACPFAHDVPGTRARGCPPPRRRRQRRAARAPPRGAGSGDAAADLLADAVGAPAAPPRRAPTESDDEYDPEPEAVPQRDGAAPERPGRESDDEYDPESLPTGRRRRASSGPTPWT